jgi:hypothetical protein
LRNTLPCFDGFLRYIQPRSINITTPQAVEFLSLPL